MSAVTRDATSLESRAEGDLCGSAPATRESQTRNTQISGDRLLMICGSSRDSRELAPLAKRDKFEVLFHNYASAELEASVARDPTSPHLDDPRYEIDALLKRCEIAQISAVASTDDYPGSALAAIVSTQLGMPGVRPAASLTCQHKFHCRTIQQNVAPSAVPQFHLVDVRPEIPLPPRLIFPVFVKPVKSYLSLGAEKIANADELARAKLQWYRKGPFFVIFETLLRMFTPYAVGYGRLLAEDCLKGHQVTLDGYVYNGTVSMLGIVDSVMFPGTLAFKRFEYPSVLPQGVQNRMAEIARTVMSSLDYGYGQFNIELIYDADTDRIAIIEINPRMSSQFADLYEKVDGTNSYEILTDLARGQRPHPRKQNGRFKAAASCVLRTFTNKRVLQIPSCSEIENLHREYPDIRIEILAEKGMRLSQQLQDGNSYRYGVINIGGRDCREIQAIFDDCARHLSFVLESAD